MTLRVRTVLLVTGAALTAALPLRGQRRGSVEVGAFVAYLNADNSLPVGDGVGFGGRAGVNIMPYLSLEADIAQVSKNGNKYSPLHVWLVYDVPPVSRAELFFGVGYVRNSYSGSYDAHDSGVGGEIGIRHRIRNRVALRLDGHADFMPSAANKSYLISYNGNWGLGLGVSALLNR
jgi:hypothetical protein